VNNQAGEPANNIRQHREAAGYTQADVAERIQVDSNSVSRWELGRVTPYLSQQRRLADVLGVTVAELGIKGRAPAETATPSPYAFLQEPEIEAVDRRISDSQNQWLQTRRALNVHRAALTEAAVRVYPPDVRVLDTTLLAPASWIPDQPVDLDNVELVLDEHATEPAVDGTEPETAHVRPLADIVRPYARYTQAIRDIAKPRLLDNRLSWRALGVDATGGQIRLKFGETTYFGTMDTHEALAHEAAYVHLTADGRPSGRPSALRALPFRRLIGDPFDLDHRPCITSISTLTVRGGTKPSFLLHRRDAQSVAVAGGMIHVAPSGVFQPSSILPAAKNADFNLWKSCSATTTPMATDMPPTTPPNRSPPSTGHAPTVGSPSPT
jgi:transcriptional regulator with XRE-family HTH domain